MVENASSFAMGLVLDGGKDIGMSAEVLAVPDGIEVSLVQAGLVPVNLSDGFGRGAGDFVGSNADQRPVLCMQSSLGVFHVTLCNLQHIPGPADGSQPWSRKLAQGMKASRVDNPEHPVSYKGPQNPSQGCQREVVPKGRQWEGHGQEELCRRFTAVQSRIRGRSELEDLISQM